MSTATYDLHALIKEARRRASKRRWAYAGVLALLAGAGIWGGLALNGGSGTAAPPAPPGYHLLRARGDVQHAVLASPYGVEVNGHRVRKVATTEVWFDRKAGLVRMRELGPRNPVEGLPPSRPSDETSRCVPYCAFSAALLEPYWPVDTSKFVRGPGLGTFHGRRVIWLGKLENTFAPAYGNGDWIALDPRTHDAIGERMYEESYKPTGGKIFYENWVVKRFADIPSNRFWFPVKDKPLDVLFTRLQPVPLYVPGHAPVTDLRDTNRIVVGRLARATIFAAARPDGSWRFFSASKDGRVDGHSRVDDPHTLRAGLVQVGHGSLFSSRAYLVVAGSMFARPGTKLFAVFADGSRHRLELIPSGKPTGPAAFHYYVIPPLRYARNRRMTAFEIVRGSRVVAHDDSFMGYQAPQQPAPLPLQAALRVFDSQAP